MFKTPRGAIRNRTAAHQLRNFEGLCFGKKTPTDIDGFLDFNNHVFVFIEAKRGEQMPATGQRLALERLADACESAGKHTLLIVATHDCPADEDVDYAKINVFKYRTRGEWKAPPRQITVRAIIEKFLAEHQELP